MEDREFISQMATFSSLEQMTNMSTGFTKLASMLSGSEAVSTIGKTVELTVGENVVTGQVQAVTRGENPQLIVNGMPYSMEQINKIYGN